VSTEKGQNSPTAKELCADVVVVGFGGAGAVAAIEAYDAGASVIVLERSNEGGGNTCESGGSIRLLEDVNEAVEHFQALTLGTTPKQVLQVLAEGIARIPAWITEHGGSLTTVKRSHRINHYPTFSDTTAYPSLPGASGIGSRVRIESMDQETGGEALWNLLKSNVESRKIRVIYNARAHRLLRDPTTGEIAGVIANTTNGQMKVDIRKAVILTCGGFAHNFEMQRQYIGTDLPSAGPPSKDTGDGIAMAQDVGADLWHMNAAAVTFGYNIPGLDACYEIDMASTAFIWVDQLGRRFVNETSVDNHQAFLITGTVDPVEGKYLRLPSYLIFDEKLRKSGPIARTDIGYAHHFVWSKENTDEIEKGWITEGATITEVAEKLGLPPGKLETTVTRYNNACIKGEDNFGRPRDEMKPLDNPPFYGIALWTVFINTQGGPRRNEKAQILDVFRKPIPRLYSAGELGSVWGHLYPGAGNVSEAIVFGWIAGKNAAAETLLLNRNSARN
jgi:succinate dehydrogenase/fumarate reductase flavoprotein subunit